jgi:hypothetical protein
MSLKTDLADLTEILEDFVARKDTMSEQELIDLAARLKPAAKACEVIDKYVKEQVKVKLNHKSGFRNGNMFKAILTLVPTNRFAQAAFKEARPKLYAAFCDKSDEERITFDVR